MKILRIFTRPISRLIKFQRFNKGFLKFLPIEYHPAAKLVFYNKRAFTSEEKKLGNEIESFRAKIPELIDKPKIESYTSPHSNSFRYKEGSEHAEPGELVVGSIENHLKTGSGIFKGLLLKRIIEGTRAKKILELGTNTGFSGCYFLSVNDTELVTVEGSESLCKIAEKNLSRISKSFKIMNCLFDEAIDQLITNNEKFDCLYLDGQHEREAMLHYTKRVAPIMSEGAIFIYDDIYWSEGMNQAWKELCQEYEFSQGVDLLTFGILKKNKEDQKSVIYDIGDYVPRPAEFYRKGW